MPAMGATVDAKRLNWDAPLIETPFDCPRCGAVLVQHRHPDAAQRATVFYHGHAGEARRFSLVVPDRAILHRRQRGHTMAPLTALWRDLMDWCDALHDVLDEADHWEAVGDATAETFFVRTATPARLVLGDGREVTIHNPRFGPFFGGPIAPAS